MRQNQTSFVASRAHHADIGGTTPGSMPPFSKTIEEEGVLFELLCACRRGSAPRERTREALLSARYPARNPDQNVADLQAQLAANARGIAEIERAVQRHTLPVVRSYMRHVQDNAAASVRNAIDRLQPGEFRYELDSGRVIAVVSTLITHARARESTSPARRLKTLTTSMPHAQCAWRQCCTFSAR